MLITDRNYSKQSVVTRLGEGLSISGVLSNEGIKRSLDAVLDYIAAAKKAGVKDIHIFATQAVRAAQNSDYFKKLFYNQTGYDLEVLDSADEALCGFLGAVSDMSQEINIAVLDIGGASTEITIGVSPNQSIYSKSLPIGAVSLRDLYLNDITQFESQINKELDRLGCIKADTFVGIGGTFGSLSAILLGLKTYDARKTHNSIIMYNALQDLKKSLWQKDDAQIYNEYPFLGQRAKTIKYGALWALELMKRLNINAIQISEKDILEGYCILKNIKA
jgi:exopolyphosphatase/guanosine-5'-triphosphate,3'-diphosphate pyrophosphatase